MTPTSGVHPTDRSGLLRVAPIGSFGRYQILGRVALGGMAEIFLSRERNDAGMSRTIIIKRVLPHVADDDRFVRMFLDEARLAMNLNHPNICHIYEFGREQGSYFIAMEWVDGVPLGRLIKSARKQYGAVPPGIASRVIAVTAEALDYAHRARDESGRPLNIVHRDVSPQNIMISYDGQVKLLDFGIAKAESHLTKTSDGQVKGKFAYMSPEQCRGEPVDARSDVFALGICLYEALTGRNLYKRNSEYETFRAIIEDPVPSVRDINPEVPETLDRIVKTALAKNADDRFPTAGAVQRALEGWLAETRQVVNAGTAAQLMNLLFAEDIKTGPSIEAVPFGGVQEAPKKSRLASGVIIGLLAMLIVVVGGGIAAYLATRTSEPETPIAAAPGGDPSTAPTEAPGEPVAPSGDVAPWEGGDRAPTPTGALRIGSDPSGASVLVDDREQEGTTPLSVSGLMPGAHEIEIRLGGRRTHHETVTIVAGHEATLDATLRARRGGAAAGGHESEADAGEGTLAINTRPWSKVYVGSRLLGTTPLTTTVPAGTLRLRLEDRDGTVHDRTVSVTADETTRSFFDLGSP